MTFGRPHVGRWRGLEHLLICTPHPAMISAPRSANPMESMTCSGRQPDSITLYCDQRYRNQQVDHRGPPTRARGQEWSIQPGRSRDVVTEQGGHSILPLPSTVDEADNK